MTISTHPASQGPRARFRRAALALGLLLVLASACGDSEPEPSSTPPAGTPVAKAPAPPAPQRTVPDPAEVSRKSIPEGFPDDLPLYPDSRPINWIIQTTGTVVAFEADGDPEGVYEFFAAKLPDAGWDLETQSATPPPWRLVAVKSGRKALISIASLPDGGTQFGVATSNAD